jgi:hypothetical protein
VNVTLDSDLGQGKWKIGHISRNRANTTNGHAAIDQNPIISACLDGDVLFGPATHLNPKGDEGMGIFDLWQIGEHEPLRTRYDDERFRKRSTCDAHSTIAGFVFEATLRPPGQVAATVTEALRAFPCDAPPIAARFSLHALIPADAAVVPVDLFVGAVVLSTLTGEFRWTNALTIDTALARILSRI